MPKSSRNYAENEVKFNCLGTTDDSKRQEILKIVNEAKSIAVLKSELKKLGFDAVKIEKFIEANEDDVLKDLLE